MVQDDGPVGLDGLQVKLHDERVVSDAGVMLLRDVGDTLADRGAGGWAGAPAARAARRGQRGAQGDGVDLRDGAGRRLHR